MDQAAQRLSSREDRRWSRSMYMRTLFVLVVAWTFKPAIATAQYDVQQCTWVLQQISRSLKEDLIKQIVSLERQYLTYCNQMPANDYAGHLATLAFALNKDGQHQEA